MAVDTCLAGRCCWQVLLECSAFGWTNAAAGHRFCPAAAPGQSSPSPADVAPAAMGACIMHMDIVTVHIVPVSHDHCTAKTCRQICFLRV